ncbi:hypothetical protein [Pseudoprimorskyibacter insulae]|uniref:Uncharacterized protein n=1 Tax=Pseudoprimorskyibacter insulae TaxID=1695997 RepID=A0A2R8AQG0_9RHOB|nr:hypothetical protein [Pseudoprimorskyibacter insulae]SPF78107.1 hypothetical protein PRI8871_00698 [Pseudoprimorskyibacter insulae]
MIVALVREIDKKYWAGVYAAPTIERLREIVAEVSHPSECEYTCLTDFGLIVDNVGTPPTIPLGEDDAEEGDFVPSDEDLWLHSDRLNFTMAPSMSLKPKVERPGLEWSPLDPDFKHFRSELRVQLSSHEGRLDWLEYLEFMEAHDEDFPKRAVEFRILVDAIKDAPNATEIAHVFFDL